MSDTILNTARQLLFSCSVKPFVHPTSKWTLWTKMNHNVTLGLDFTSLFFFCAMSESESSSESVSELEELSDDELLVWATGPLPFSSESLKHTRTAETDLRHGVNTVRTTRLKNSRKNKLGNNSYSFPSWLKAQPRHNNNDQSAFGCEVNSLKKIFSIFLLSLSLDLSLFNLSR